MARPLNRPTTLIPLIGLLFLGACSSGDTPAPLDPQRITSAISPNTTISVEVQSEASASGWRADLAVLAGTMPAIHPNLYWRVSEAEFQAAVEALEAAIPTLSDDQIIVEMARIASLIDGHTHLPMFQDAVGFHLYPLRLYQFSDGLFVVEASDEYSDLVGSRVARIGNLDAAQAYERIAPLVPRDNDATVRLLTPVYLTVPEALLALDIINDVEKPGFVLETLDGETVVVDPPPMGTDHVRDWTSLFIDLAGLPGRSETLHLQNLDEYIWFTAFPDGESLYIQYNQVQEVSPSGTSLRGVIAEIEALLAEQPINRIILDMRHNPGGNVNSSPPLLAMLINSAVASQPQGLFVITGPQTFSAAILFAVDLEQNLAPVFVGEPTGGRPNLYGDVKPTVLPNSGISVLVSTIYWERSDPNDPRDWIEPDLPAALSSEDFFEGRDPALEAILE